MLNVNCKCAFQPLPQLKYDCVGNTVCEKSLAGPDGCLMLSVVCSCGEKHSLMLSFKFLVGISLNPEQWNQLKDQISEIDDAIKRI